MKLSHLWKHLPEGLLASFFIAFIFSFFWLMHHDPRVNHNLKEHVDYEIVNHDGQDYYQIVAFCLSFKSACK